MYVNYYTREMMNEGDMYVGIEDNKAVCAIV